MSEQTYKQGQNDARQNKGAPAHNSFASAKDRNDYFAGRNGK